MLSKALCALLKWNIRWYGLRSHRTKKLAISMTSCLLTEIQRSKEKLTALEVPFKYLITYLYYIIMASIYPCETKALIQTCNQNTGTKYINDCEIY